MKNIHVVEVEVHRICEKEDKIKEVIDDLENVIKNLEIFYQKLNNINPQKIEKNTSNLNLFYDEIIELESESIEDELIDLYRDDVSEFSFSNLKLILKEEYEYLTYYKKIKFFFKNLKIFFFKNLKIFFFKNFKKKYFLKNFKKLNCFNFKKLNCFNFKKNYFNFIIENFTNFLSYINSQKIIIKNSITPSYYSLNTYEELIEHFKLIEQNNEVLIIMKLFNFKKIAFILSKNEFKNKLWEIDWNEKLKKKRDICFEELKKKFKNPDKYFGKKSYCLTDCEKTIKAFGLLDEGGYILSGFICEILFNNLLKMNILKYKIYKFDYISKYKYKIHSVYIYIKN